MRPYYGYGYRPYGYAYPRYGYYRLYCPPYAYYRGYGYRYWRPGRSFGFASSQNIRGGAQRRYLRDQFAA